MANSVFEQNKGVPEPSPDEVRAQVEKILLHPEFATSQKLKAFLRFVVEETLEGRAEGLKGYTIGVEVYGRDESFDPQIDTLVRVEAGRLRRKLQIYYSNEGRDDPICVEVPKGSYVPVWGVRTNSEPEPTPAARGTGKMRWRWVTAAAWAILLILSGTAVWTTYVRTQAPPIEPDSLKKKIFPFQKPSILVLTFKNLTGDPEQEYFSDGFTETLITGLAKAQRIIVIPANSKIPPKNPSVTIRQVAEKVGAQYVLDGSLQKLGDRVRITAQLIDALNGFQLWGEQYDRPFQSTLAIQDEISSKVVKKIRQKMRDVTFARGASTPESMDYFLRGIDHAKRATKADNALARRMFQKAAELDPEWAQPWAMIGRTYVLDIKYGWSEEDPQNLEKLAFNLAKKAVALDDTNANAHMLLAGRYLYLRHHGKALVHAEQALALDPDNPPLLVQVGHILYVSGRLQEAIELVKKAMQLDPSPPVWYAHHLARAYRLSGQYDKAIKIYEEDLVRQPGKWILHMELALAYAQNGEIDKARGEIEKVLQLRPKYSAESYKVPYKDPWVLKRDLEALRLAGLPE